MRKRRDNPEKIGFWNTPRNTYPELPMPEDYVDDSWDETERAKVVEYLSTAKICKRYRGMSRCRVCGKYNGSTERSDGKYLWPDGYAHYIFEHGVKPPEDFIEWVERKNRTCGT